MKKQIIDILYITTMICFGIAGGIVIALVIMSRL